MDTNGPRSEICENLRNLCDLKIFLCEKSRCRICETKDLPSVRICKERQGDIDKALVSFDIRVQLVLLVIRAIIAVGEA